METLIHADIFFFITSVFVLIIIIAFVIAACFIIPILKDMRHISRLARKESEKLAEDIGDFRDTIKREGLKVRSIFDFFLGLFASRRDLHRKKKEKRSVE